MRMNLQRKLIEECTEASVIAKTLEIPSDEILLRKLITASQNILGEIISFSQAPYSINFSEYQKINIGLFALRGIEPYLMEGENNQQLQNYAASLHAINSNLIKFICHFNPKFNIFQQYLRGHQIANQFYKNHGVDKNTRISHLTGIDLSKPVEVITFKSPVKVIYQWQGTLRGDYYTPEKNATPTQLGINKYIQDRNTSSITLRQQKKYRKSKPIHNIELLKSVAAKTYDDWSVPNKPVFTNGGAVQYFNRNDKSDIKEIKTP